jgi:ribose transport system substrate-binding protein
MTDKELNILATIHSLEPGVSRRTFMHLAGAAGISLAMTPAVARVAEAADVIRGKIASTGLTPAIDFWSVWQRAFHTAAAALGLDPQDFFHEGDTGRALAQVRSLPASSTKMLIGLVDPAGALPTVTKLCEDSGTYYVALFDSPSWFTPPDIGDHYVSLITPDSVRDAYEVAKILFESVGGEGKIVHIKGLAAPTDAYRTTGLMKAAAEFPGIQIVGGLRANWDRELARNVMLSTLAAHPDVKGVFAQSDDMAFGVLSVLRQRGMANVKVASIIGLPEGLREVAKGENFIATQSVSPPYMAGFSTVLVFDALNGWKPNLGERLLNTGSLLATPEDAAKIEQTIFGKDANPYDWVLMSRTLSPDSWDPQNKITAIDPEEFWADYPEGKEKLNSAYASAKDRGEFSKVDALYAEHYKNGPGKSLQVGQ